MYASIDIDIRLTIPLDAGIYIHLTGWRAGKGTISLWRETRDVRAVVTLLAMIAPAGERERVLRAHIAMTEDCLVE